MLFIYYRSTGNENKKKRPDYYTKLTCLKSFLLAVEQIQDNVKLIFINDGAIPQERLDIMHAFGSVVQLNGAGNSGSYRIMLKMAWELTNNDYFYFAEDDYLYKSDALSHFCEALDTLKHVDYITLYDHPDRYTRTDDARRGYSKVYIASGIHWRTVDSSCMTFGGRVSVLKNDRRAHLTWTSFKTPRDRWMWRYLQGTVLFRWKFPKRSLVSPMPSLATHMELDLEAPNIDWETIAAGIDKAFEERFADTLSTTHAP